jgi:hypothetical protein
MGPVAKQADVAARLECTLAESTDQNLYPIVNPTVRGRSGTSDLMNCADDVNVLA